MNETHGPTPCPAPMLLAVHPDEQHIFDLYLEEILLTEGYNCYDKATNVAGLSAEDLAPYALAVVSSGAAHQMPREAVEEYMRGGGRAVVFQPPRDWGPMFGLQSVGEMYSIAPDAYVRVNGEHAWMRDFPTLDLQCPGENEVYANEGAEALVFTAGQLGEPSVFPAVALRRIEQGAGVMFTYDLADCIVLTHQGRTENASTGANPDANRDGKFCPDDALVGMRDFALRHVPQADVHQDILGRAIVGLTGDQMPLPRLWHFPNAAPAAFFVNGDGDGMIWDDLVWVLDAVKEFGVKYTCYLMDEQIEAFSPDDVAAVRAQGHDFGPHPWVGFKPTVQEWQDGIAGIVSRFERKFGFRPQSLRTHSGIFPGWDDSPRIFAESGLRLDTSFACGYRYASGYMNGSALPVKFMGRDGSVIDCYEQSTVQIEDGACTPKCLLPVMSEDEALQLSRELIRECAEVYHGVYHPYFHPINLGGRGRVPCQRWFREVMRATREHGLPSVTGEEWVAFNDARRAARIHEVSWSRQERDLRFEVSASLPVDSLTVMLPPCAGCPPDSATVDGEPVGLARVSHEKLGWTALVMDLRAGESRTVAVRYAAPQ